MKKILITGANGLVGNAIISNSNSKNFVKVGKEINLKDFSTINNLLKTELPSHVVHCAAKVGGLGGNMMYKGEFFYDNITMNTNLLESCRINNVKKVVSFLSTCIFPDNVTYPLTEDKIHLGPPHNSNYAYAHAKRMLDIQSKSYRDQYGLNYVCVIPTNIYGINDNFSLSNGHVIPMLIHKLFLSKKNKKDFIVWGTGDAKREFIFSKDVALLSLWALENFDEDEPIIFSPSQEITIKDLVDLLVKEFNYKGKVIFDKTKPDGQLRKPTDNSKLMSYLPNFKFTPIEQGIKETVKWFIDNYEYIRK
jgi:GDP-L-fucose synthase